MNDKQLEQAKRQLREEKHSLTTEEYKLREAELWCIDMINSILAYQGQGMTNAEDVMQMQESRYHNYLADYVKELGREKVLTLIQGQIDSIAYVKNCVHIDGEGVSYNSIIWKN